MPPRCQPLRQRLSENDPGDERVAGKMPGKHRIVARKPVLHSPASARIAAENFPNEDERGPVRKLGEVWSL